MSMGDCEWIRVHTLPETWADWAGDLLPLVYLSCSRSRTSGPVGESIHLCAGGGHQARGWACQVWQEVAVHVDMDQLIHLAQLVALSAGDPDLGGRARPPIHGVV